MYTVKSLAWTAVLAALINVEWVQAGRCQPDEYERNVGSLSFCYKIMSAQPVTQIEEKRICKNSASSVSYAETFDELNRIAETAKLAGFATSEEGPGVWLPFKRLNELPVGAPDYENLRATSRYDKVYLDGLGEIQPVLGGRFNQDVWRKGRCGFGRAAGPAGRQAG